jgi:cytochrome c oxidase assembly protein subunit 15
MERSKLDLPFIAWLWTVLVLVFLMILLGGITRITGSGLSIVDWKPIMGVIPPLNEIDWQEAFFKYQQFPQFKLINSTMSLSEFKQIYFWEYFHRLVGRSIGMVYLFGLLYFWLKKRLNTGLKIRLMIGFILGGLQGLLGWIMVKSGLIDQPYVSHIRLALHLSLAVFLLMFLFWIILGQVSHVRQSRSFMCLRLYAKCLLGLILVQIIYGAFVAGLKLGMCIIRFRR